MKYLLSLAIFVLTALAVYAQPPTNINEYQEEYNKRIKQSTLYGVYIPKDLADAFVQLNSKIDDTSRTKFKNAPEEVVAKKLYFSLGRWISHNWGFYGGSRLSHYLKEIGLTHPDDMSQFIIIAYHRNLNRQPLEVKALVEEFVTKRELNAKKRIKVIAEEKVKRDTTEQKIDE